MIKYLVELEATHPEYGFKVFKYIFETENGVTNEVTNKFCEAIKRKSPNWEIGLIKFRKID